jgi:VCBS repeat-containing protein
VTGTNDGPTATVDIATTDEDAAVTFGVLSNDTDPDTSDTLSVTSASVTSGLGSVVVNLDNTLTYTPATSYNSLAAGETASVEVTYAISDGNGGTSSSVATITVTGTNDGPTATVDIATTDEDAAVTFGVLSNDTDPDTSDTLSVTSASVTSGLGSVVVNLDNTLTYTPATSYNSLAAGETASVEVTYAISDGNGGTSSSVATITVTGTNDGPTATVDIATTDEDAAVTFGVLSNDTDPDTSDTLSVTSASVTSGLGSVVVNLDNTLTYTPATSYNSLAAGETASVEVTYAISDGNGGTSSSVATITVTGTNDGPTATVDIATTDEDAAVTFGVLSNDTDPDTSDTLSVTSASVTSGLGSVVVNLDNTLTYTPATSYNSLAAGETASVEVTYAISDGNGGTSSSVATITVTGTNDGPTATVDIATTDEDAAVTFGVLSNDTDPDTSDTLSVTSASVTSGLGSVVVNLDNTLTYTPATSYNSLAAGETASVEVTYAISDGNGGTSSSVATITVTGTNDGPTATVDIATTDEDAAVTFGVLSNDTDPDTSDTLSVTSASVTSGLGSVVVNLDNTLTYTPATSYNSLAAGETASVEVTYAISDGNGGTSSSVATITVTGTNDGPTATVDIATTDEDAAVTFGVLSNDTDPDTSDTLSVTSASVTSGLGSVVVNLDNTLTYTPAISYNSLAAGETASVEVTYAISDGNGGTSSSVATITVTGTNDGPTATVDIATTDEDAAVTFGVLSNDTDPDTSDTLSVTSASVTSGLGSVVVNLDNTLTYTPATSYNSLAAGETASVEVTYAISDGNGGTSSSVATITVTGTNDGPVAVADSEAGTEDSTITGSVASNDSDVDDAASLTYVLAAPVAGLTLNTDGSYSFNAGDAAYQHLAEGATLVVAADYTVSDGLGGTDSETLTITLTGTNDVPVITTTSLSLEENTTEAGTVLVTDPDTADHKHYSLVGGADAALFSIDANTGALSFISAPDFEDPVDAGGTPGDNVYQVIVQVADDMGATDAQAIDVTVTNDTTEAPVTETNTGLTVAENSTNTVISTAVLNTTDQDTGTSAIVYTLTGIPSHGTLTKNGVAMSVGAVPSRRPTSTAELFKYSNNGDESASDGFSFTHLRWSEQHSDPADLRNHSCWCQRQCPGLDGGQRNGEPRRERSSRDRRRGRC